MDTRRIKNPQTGEFIDIPIVKILEEENHPVIIKLEDGSTLQAKLDISQVALLPGLGTTGEPIYFVQNSVTFSVLDFK